MGKNKLKGNGVRSVMKNSSSSQIVLLAIVLAVYVIIMCCLTQNFYQPKNVMNILTQITPLGIAAAGAGIVMIAGGIDLTIGNIVSLVGCVMAVMMSQGIDNGTCVIVGLLVGLGCGAANGTLVVVSKAEPFIVTLGMMSVYKGLTLLVTGGMNITAASDYNFGRAKIAEIIPVAAVCLVAVFVALYLVFKYTKFGRRAYAIGNNTEAAYLAGVKVKRNKVFVYMLNGGLLAFAAMIMLSRLSSANSIMGDELLMQGIAAAVIGGVSLAGGRGNLWGVFLGTVLIGVISNSLNLLSVAAYYQYIVLGAIIVGAVFVSNFRSKSR